MSTPLQINSADDQRAWDLFAAAALAALVKDTIAKPDYEAIHAAAHADAMMVQRAKRRGGLFEPHKPAAWCAQCGNYLGDGSCPACERARA